MNEISTLDLATRFAENPLLTRKNLKPSSPGMIVESMLNPGVFRFQRKTWLIVRVTESPEQTDGYVSVPKHNGNGEVEILRFDKTDPQLSFTKARRIQYGAQEYSTTLSHLRLMCSEDGRTFYEQESYPPIFGESELDSFGIEDCRVSEIDDIFYLTYNMLSSSGCAVGLMQTRDWKRFERKGMIFPPHNKDCAMFEDKVKDKYFALHRPTSLAPGGNCNIWLADSPDSIHWGRHACIAKTRPNMWDSARIGAGCSPIRTPRGWLAIYYGTDENHRYCLGALLLDLSDPTRVIGRSASPIMEPSEPYELDGVFGNRIFTNGHVVLGDKIVLYYAASADVICGAEFSVKEVLDSLSR